MFGSAIFRASPAKTPGRHAAFRLQHFLIIVERLPSLTPRSKPRELNQRCAQITGTDSLEQPPAAFPAKIAADFLQPSLA
jgi:hypothetical protein